MYLFIGLGNPGTEYAKTRHNAGWLALEALRKKFDFEDFADEKKFFAAVSQGKIGKEKIILALPGTMMNASGKAVATLVSFYKVKPDHVVVFQDDSDIVFGSTKLSFARSSAGHRGVESVKRALKTDKFWRVRIGIQPSAKKHVPAMDLVLRPFKPSEMNDLKKIWKRLAEGIEIGLSKELSMAMNHINS